MLVFDKSEIKNALSIDNIFELLNDSKIDFDEYKEIELNDSQKEDIFNGVKTKINFKKNNKKNIRHILFYVLK